VRKVSIYALHDPRDWSIRYVGKASNPEYRHGRRRSHNRLLQRFLSELRDLGMKPRVTILQTCSADQWQVWERFWIATVKAAGEQLLNLHPGGEGPIEARAWNKGKKLSPEYRKKLSDAHKGTLSKERAVAMAKLSSGHTKPHSAETKEKMRAAKLGKKQTLEHREKVGAYFRGRKREPGSMKWL
jgi:hypothetical protein